MKEKVTLSDLIYVLEQTENVFITERLKELKEITWWAIRTRIDENGKEYLTRDYCNKKFYKKQLNKKFFLLFKNTKKC